MAYVRFHGIVYVWFHVYKPVNYVWNDGKEFRTGGVKYVWFHVKILDFYTEEH